MEDSEELLDAYLQDEERFLLVLSETAVESDKMLIAANVGMSFLSRFENGGTMEDLRRAIMMHEEAVLSTPADHPALPELLDRLGVALYLRSERTGSIDDINRAITALTRAVELGSPRDDHEYLNDLGNALQSRFERTGSILDLERAVTMNERAVNSTPDKQYTHVIYLNNLANSLQRLFERKGSMDDLDQAVVMRERTVELTPSDNPDRATVLNNLGVTLRKRFERTGSMDDLDRAIMMNRQAIASSDNPKFITPLHNLAIALSLRFQRTRSMNDLNEAVRLNEQAVASTSDTDPWYIMYLNSLGVTLRYRFEETNSVSDLSQSIEITMQALSLTPPDLPDRLGLLNNLGNALQRRFEKMASVEDLDQAISMHEQAVASAPDDHPDLASWFTNLGHALQSRFERTGSMEDLDRAIETYERGINSHAAPPFMRLRAARACGDLLISRKMHKHAKLILETAVHLLPNLNPRQLKRTDAQFNISQFANLTARAVSLRLENLDDLYGSLQILELGRGILANLQLEVRSDISELGAKHPGLAQQFQQLRDKIDSPSVAPLPFTTDDPLAQNQSNIIAERSVLLEKFNALLLHIRSLQDFETFLRGPSESELRSLAGEDSIVVFNVSDIRSDAFLITDKEIRVVHLPLLTSDSIEVMTTRYLTAIENQRLSQHNQSMLEINGVLEWLWDSAANPVLNQLGFIQRPCDRNWPRVWWVGSGILNILPIHAAGYHDSTPSQATLECVISSYIPTVKSLAYARERIAEPDQCQNAVLIAMPTTPAQNDLPFVEAEVKELVNLLTKASIHTKVMHNPTRMEVLSELPQSSIVHFTCHGYPAEDPSQSSFLLQDWETSPLTVSDLISLNIRSAKLAYLSACHTSAMRDLHLLDESISLSSAIQLSGFPSVVGSLWQVTDNHSAQVAKEVYEWISADAKFNVERAAEGLHKAVLQLRDSTRFMRKQDPLLWASYIHVGI